MRIVSLIPAGTEIVDALGFTGSLVGRSHECDRPEAVRSLPACTGPRFDPEGSSAEIDRRVAEALREALSVYRVDEARLRELAPDVIVTQDQCAVCAVSKSDVEASVAARLDRPVRVVSLEAADLDGLWRDIETVSLALGVFEQGQYLIARLKTRMADVAGSLPTLEVDRPSVVCLEWLDPLMGAGNWIPELVQMAGGRNLLSRAGEHSGRLSWSDLADADPDVILLMPCGFGLSRTLDEARRSFDGRQEWTSLRAVREGRVYAVDGNRYFSRPGPGLAESLEILAEILNPWIHGFGHRDRAWRPFGA